MTAFAKKFLFSILIAGYFLFPFWAVGQVINIDASKLQSRVELKFSPRAGSFEEGSTFQVPILLNTKGQSVNGIEVRVNFDKDKLSIINPTGGTSIIGVWVEPPKFDNTRGTASYVGVVPNGITTEAGLIGTITFQAKAVGAAAVSFASNSKILLNDGLGTEVQVDLGRADYSILTKAPDGVQVYSETHPIQSDWYNNNTPVISWIKDEGVTGFSYELDNKPNTIPDNIIDTTDTTKTFPNLNDGLSYFHIKANKGDAWGTTGHFLIRIDTTPPAEFTPETNYLVASVVLAERTLVSFFTTDNLSGVDHYEVGVIDKSQPLTESPVFIQTESPFQVPLTQNGKLQVIVRAVDKAGNVRDESVAVAMPFALTKFIKDYLVYILIGFILLAFLMLILHYLIGHHVIRTLGNMRRILRREKLEEAERILYKERKEEIYEPPIFSRPDPVVEPTPPPVPPPAPRPTPPPAPAPQPTPPPIFRPAPPPIRSYTPPPIPTYTPPPAPVSIPPAAKPILPKADIPPAPEYPIYSPLISAVPPIPTPPPRPEIPTPPPRVISPITNSFPAFTFPTPTPDLFVDNTPINPIIPPHANESHIYPPIINPDGTPETP